jgi:hypothetical protein
VTGPRPNLLLLTVLLSVLAVAVASGATAIGVAALHHATEASMHAANALHRVEREQEQLKIAAHNTLISRETTVKQRCELTEHIGEHFPLDPWFVGSHNECRMQLAQLYAEATASP